MPKKIKSVKEKRAWLILSGGDISPWGNGQEWQFPIFLSAIEARHFLARNSRADNSDYKIIPIKIIPLTK